MSAPTTPVPGRAGIGLRAPHYGACLESPPPVGWLEVHSENFFAPAAKSLAVLERLRADYPVSVHGVGLALGSAAGIDPRHLARLKELVDRIEPALVSEHLCWGRVGGRHFNDLLPLPYTEEALATFCSAIDRAQSHLGRPILVENLSAYLRCRHDTLSEWQFIAEVVRRTGCGLLLDVNNIYVTATNFGLDAAAAFDTVPWDAVAEIHLAGFEDAGDHLLDTHGTRVSEPVWALYRAAIDRGGPRPTLIEWDTDIPPLAVLLEEAARADAILEGRHALAA